MNKKFWSGRIKNAKPYVPGEQPQDKRYIKLNTNESPYPPAPAVHKALRNFDTGQLRLYPDPQQSELRTALAEQFNQRKENVFVGNGSDEVLAFCFQAFFETGSEALPVLTPELGYSFYPVYAEFFDVNLKKLALKEDLSLDVADYGIPSQAVILANPNAPTALFLKNREIEVLLRQNPDRLVIVDEAYVDFAVESAVDLLNDYDNLLIVQTFSKSRALAGLRLGFALGHQDLILALEVVRDSINSYPVDRLAQSLALASLSEGRYFAENCARIVRTREKLKSDLSKLSVECTDSQANFLWLKVPGFPGEKIYSTLKEQGILIRFFKQPALQDYVRVTIGSEDEMSQFLHVFAKLIQSRRGIISSNEKGDCYDRAKKSLVEQADERN